MIVDDVSPGQRNGGEPGVTVCKTVGSAYPGSNPGPATHKPRSEPVTRDCVTGSCAQSKRCRRPLVGHVWARSGRPWQRRHRRPASRNLRLTWVNVLGVGGSPGGSFCRMDVGELPDVGHSRTYSGQDLGGGSGAANRLLSPAVRGSAG